MYRNRFHKFRQGIYKIVGPGLMAAIFLIGSLPLLAQNWTPHFERLDHVEGLAHTVIVKSFQDSKGFIWLGELGGLKLYDGKQVTSYMHDPDNPKSLSDNTIRGICEDRQGYIWIATGDGLNRFDHSTNEFTRFFHDPDNPNSPRDSKFHSVLVGSNGLLFLGTKKGLDQFDQERGQFKHVQVPSLARQLPVYNMSLSKSGKIWLSQGEGVTRFDPQKNRFEFFRMAVLDQVGGTRSLLETRDGLLLVGSKGGLLQFNPNNGEVVRFKHDADDLSSISHDDILSLLQDRGGRIWVGTNSKGLNLFDPDEGTFRHFRYSPTNPNSLISDITSTLLEDQSGVLWFGSYEGITRCDPGKSKFSKWRHDPKNINSLLGEEVLCYFEDKQGIVWMGANKGLNRFDPKTQQFTHYQYDPHDQNSLSADKIWAIDGDRDGMLWLTPHQGGVNRFDPETERVTRFSLNLATSNRVVYCDDDGLVWLGHKFGLDRLDPVSGNIKTYRQQPGDSKSFIGGHVRDLLEDREGAIWVASFGGLSRLDQDRESFSRFRHDSENPLSLGHSKVWDLFEDSSGRLWVGTDGGLEQFVPHQGNPNSGIFTHFKKDGKMPRMVERIEEDGKGYLWLWGNGIWRFDPRTGKCLQFDDGASDAIASGLGLLRTQGGRIYYGTGTGFTCFDPSQITQDLIAPSISFTEFNVLNKPAEIGPSGPLKQHIRSAKSATLTHEQKVFTFKYAALSFNSPEKNRYVYQMVGFDENWSESTRDNFATYTNLNADTYTFRVKASNANDFWNEEGIEIKVRVLPPLWLTWWAKSLYALAALAALAAYLRAQHRKLDYQTSVNKQLQRMDVLKDEFLANTSHELRTPINGIIGLAVSISDRVGDNLDSNTQVDLSLIVSSGRRLANLVNDILDFSKLKDHSLEIQQGAVDLHSLCAVVLALTRPLLVGRDLDLINNIPTDFPLARGDEDRLQQVFFNLIGNAVKFTYSGSVVVSAGVVEAGLSISVADTGIGIPAENLETIFSSFEQVDGSTSREYGGTGLGLAVSRQLVELHEGTISVVSKVGEGSVFTLTLPPSKDGAEIRYQTAKSVSSIGMPSKEISVPTAPKQIERSVTQLSPDNGHVNGRFRILVVDDEPVNRRVLLNHLSLRNYQVVEATDGREAISLLMSGQTFDLVLLDVMMPGLSGYEVCGILRESFSLKDLPVIFLTAKNQVTDLVTAFEAGGNDFLSKPVSKEELLSRVTTHLQLLDANRNLESRVSERTEELNSRNQQILSSINYAQRIQNALLPELGEMGKSLHDFFVLFRPKDIVSGDFYWFCRLQDMLFIAVIDCTGHGVPGAFMSMIGHTLLNQIVKGDRIYDLEEILLNLHLGIVKSLKQEGQVVYTTDGMDLCLIKIEDKEKRVSFVGAGRPLILVSNEDANTKPKLTVIKGDRNSVGGRRKVHERVFTGHHLSIQPGDMMYLTTDGFVDQPNLKRISYGSQRLREFLIAISPLPIKRQHEALISELDNHQQDAPQRDDITIVGIRC